MEIQNTVYINPINSLKFVLNKIKKDKIKLIKIFMYLLDQQ